MVELIEIKKDEIKLAFKMHRKGFIPTFLKYRDRINPVFNSYNQFKKYFNNDNMVMFWIVNNSIKTGQLWLGFKDDCVILSRIFVLPAYQNRGIAQKAITLAQQLYPDYKTWRLDTIKQEQRNCHLYEKLGYIPFGVERKINKRMTLIEYEKRMESNEDE